MISVGITGGIGSGKSTVARIFEVLGIPVYYADDAAKRIMNEDPSLRKAIAAAFGAESYTNGILNRHYLSQTVFNNKEKLEQLNALVHPATIRDGEQWMRSQTTPYAIKEAAIFFETGSGASLDYIIGVFAPTTLRIHRAMQRDNITREAVMARMSKQIDENIKMRLCDYVIVNDDQQPVLPQVLALHKELIALAAQKH
ncbi:MAG: dephospho-CoA kinase [Chitinophagaceae bacterium]|nr:dephospho-CoA kinase [Chitinophagaceae bacterium]